MDRRLKRVFVIVLDSMGMGAMADAARFGDEGADTLGHISQTVEHFYIPNLASLGLANLKSLKQVQPQEHPLGSCTHRQIRFCRSAGTRRRWD